jgi:hypothetical protein
MKKKLPPKKVKQLSILQRFYLNLLTLQITKAEKLISS